MSTLGTMKARIRTETRRGNTIDADIANAINDAIGAYRDKRFWWAESRTQAAFNTIPDVELYDATAPGADALARLISIDWVTLAAGSQPYRLVSMRPEAMDTLQRANPDDLADDATRLWVVFPGAYGEVLSLDRSKNPKVLTANGNAAVNAGQFDGVGDFVSTPAHPDFALLAHDFTMTCLFQCTAPGGTFHAIAGHNGSPFLTNASFRIFRSSTNVMNVNVFIGGVLLEIVGQRQFTDVLNTGIHKLTLVRSGNQLTLYIDDVSEGAITISGAISTCSENLVIGASAGGGTDQWQGSIGAFRLRVGVALAPGALGMRGGQPSSYAWYENQLRLYPVPAAVYSVRVAGLFSAAVPATDGEIGNPWMTRGERLIRSRAKLELALHRLKDAKMAEDMGLATEEALSQLISETTSKTETGRVESFW